MAGNILSPLSIWEDFNLPENFSFSVIDEDEKEGFLVKKVFLEGRKTQTGRVKIYITSVKKNNTKNLPAVFLLKDFKGESVNETLFDLAKEGYFALTVDIEGDKNDLNYCTIYPADISYANYENVKDNLNIINESVKSSCWYEWCAVLKYAFAYFKKVEGIEKLAVIGSGESATVLWQALANENSVDSAIFLYNAGFGSYKGNNKYDEKADEHFDDNTLVYIAGVEPQSYAQYVSCPVFVVANPNDVEYEADRAHDTLKRVNCEHKGILYEPKCIRGLTQNAIKTIKVFLQEALINERKDLKIVEPNISTFIENGKCKISVESFDERVKSVKLYIAEEQFVSSCRVYLEQTEYQKEGKEYIFQYTPYHKSKRILAFANVEYDNGASISTNIDFIDFDEKEITPTYKSPVLYSSRTENAERIFVQNNGITLEKAFSSKETVLSVKSGAEQIKGILIKAGIKTFALMIEKYKASNGSILMFDFFADKECDFSVTAISDYNGERIAYKYNYHTNGGNTWQNVKIEPSSFKAEDGRGLKDLTDIDVLEFDSNENVLINNLLLV